MQNPHAGEISAEEVPACRSEKAKRYNKHYIRLTCGTHELVLYDKTYQVTENGHVVVYEKLPEGVLRFEVQYRREKLRRVEKDLGLHSSTSDPLRVLWHLMENSRKLVCKHFGACCSKAPFLPLEQIEEAIKLSRFAGKTKRNMFALAYRMKRTQTIDKALKDMQNQDIQVDTLPEKFNKLCVNPAPLRKGFCRKRLPSPVELLETAGDQPFIVEMEFSKIK